MTKKTAAVLGTFAFLAVTGVAFAQTASTVVPPQTTVTTPVPPMMLLVGPQGRVLLRGTVDSVSTTSITVKSWGGDWTVNVPSTAQIMPRGAVLTNFHHGDFVGVQGTVSSIGSWTIDASLVRDWAARRALNQEVGQNIHSVNQEMRDGTPRILQGTLSGLSGETFTLTAANGTAYSVSVAAGARILQKNWLTLNFSQVQNGDSVRVWGSVASSSVTASIFRDISIPR